MTGEDADKQRAFKLVAQITLGPKFDEMAKSIEAVVESTAAAFLQQGMPTEAVRFQTQAVCELIAERTTLALETAKQRVFSSLPGELRDPDRNVSRWPGGHNHSPGVACTAAYRQDTGELIHGCPKASMRIVDP